MSKTIVTTRWRIENGRPVERVQTVEVQSHPGPAGPGAAVPETGPPAASPVGYSPGPPGPLAPEQAAPAESTAPDSAALPDTGAEAATLPQDAQGEGEAAGEQSDEETGTAMPVSRLEAANIRGMYAGLFGTTAAAASQGVSYAINNLTSLHLSPALSFTGSVVLTGAFTFTQYWTKKYAKPEGKW